MHSVFRMGTERDSAQKSVQGEPKLSRLNLFGVSGGGVIAGVLGGEGGSPSGRRGPGGARGHERGRGT